MNLKQCNSFEIGMVWGNSRNSVTLWDCNGDAGHKVVSGVSMAS